MRNDFEGVSIFLKVVEAGGFARAAEGLGISRSAVAKTIGRIEGRLRVKLFSRTTRRHNLTEEGQIYYERCVCALEELRAGEAVLEFGRFNVRGKLKIVMPSLLGRYCVLPFLLDLVNRHENVMFDISFSDSDYDLVVGRFDLAICIGLSNEKKSFLNVRRIAIQSEVLCAAPSYISQRGPVRNVEDIRHHHALVYQRNEQPCLWKFRDVYFSDLKIPTKWRLQFDDQEAIADAALRGMGIACLPRWFVHNQIKEGRLISLLEETPLASTDIYAIWPQTRFMPARLRVTIDSLSDHLEKILNCDQL